MDITSPVLTGSTTQIKCLKTRLCQFYIQNRCTRGALCLFAHSDGEVRNLPDLSKTKICVKWKRGSCRFGNSCAYAHGGKELRPIEAVVDVDVPEALRMAIKASHIVSFAGISDNRIYRNSGSQSENVLELTGLSECHEESNISKQNGGSLFDYGSNDVKTPNETTPYRKPTAASRRPSEADTKASGSSVERCHSTSSSYTDDSIDRQRISPPETASVIDKRLLRNAPLPHPSYTSHPHSQMAVTAKQSQSVNATSFPAVAITGDTSAPVVAPPPSLPDSFWPQNLITTPSFQATIRPRWMVGEDSRNGPMLPFSPGEIHNLYRVPTVPSTSTKSSWRCTPAPPTSKPPCMLHTDVVGADARMSPASYQCLNGSEKGFHRSIPAPPPMRTFTDSCAPPEPLAVRGCSEVALNSVGNGRPFDSLNSSYQRFDRSPVFLNSNTSSARDVFPLPPVAHSCIPSVPMQFTSTRYEEKPALATATTATDAGSPNTSSFCLSASQQSFFSSTPQEPVSYPQQLQQRRVPAPPPPIAPLKPATRPQDNERYVTRPFPVYPTAPPNCGHVESGFTISPTFAYNLGSQSMSVTGCDYTLSQLAPTSVAAPPVMWRVVQSDGMFSRPGCYFQAISGVKSEADLTAIPICYEE